MNKDEEELELCIKRVLDSSSQRKLVVAGPGTGKTTLFKELLKRCSGEPDNRLVLTFINSLREDLDVSLTGLARVRTLHAYCMGLLHNKTELRSGLTPTFRCLPGLAHLIGKDWEYIEGGDAPKFVSQMRKLAHGTDIDFYLCRGDYYDAVDFDDCVFRAYRQLDAQHERIDAHELLLIDEYQDFNALEAGLINLLSQRSPVLIAGDDDQALYSQLRDSTWEHIRALRRGGDFDVFDLPFCMRCPKVIVDAVNDVLRRARERAKLHGRIDKPYKHFPPAKAADSEKYPTIARVFASVQRAQANYMGRYVAEIVSHVPQDEIDAARDGNYPAVLVIVAKPYRTQIVDYLEKQGFPVETKKDTENQLDREDGLSILKTDPQANLGWRIVLDSEPHALTAQVIRRSKGTTTPLGHLVPDDTRQRLLAEVALWEPKTASTEDDKTLAVDEKKPVVRVTSFEGAKGLSAQHVVIAGLHDGELPHDPQNIADIEICRFLVGLTRTRKRCYLLHTGRFAGVQKSASTFLSWIAPERYERVRVDASYWKRKAKVV